MFKKASFVLVAFFALNITLSIFSSCKRRSSSNGTKCSTTCFLIGSSDISLYDRANQKVVEAPYIVKATDLIIRVTTKGATNVCMKPKAEARHDLSLFSTAYAYAPQPTCFIKQGGDSVITYNIYSDKDFDTAHPAGSNLKDIIETTSIPRSLSTYGGSAPQILYEFFVHAEPANDGTHIFTVELVQKDGDVISLKTPAVQLQK